MTSEADDFVTRVLTADGGNEDDTAQRILDAAERQIAAVGLRRATVEEVARTAGVGRVTVYRRFGGKDALMEAVILRDARRGVAEVAAAVEPLSGEDRTVEGFLAMLRVVRGNPMLQRLLSIEADEVLPFLTTHGAPIITIGTAFIAAQIRGAQERGELPVYDPEPIAEILARLAHSLILTPGGGRRLDTERAAREFARKHIVPLLAQAGA